MSASIFQARVLRYQFFLYFLALENPQLFFHMCHNYPSLFFCTIVWDIIIHIALHKCNFIETQKQHLTSSQFFLQSDSNGDICAAWENILKIKIFCSFSNNKVIRIDWKTVIWHVRASWTFAESCFATCLKISLSCQITWERICFVLSAYSYILYGLTLFTLTIFYKLL
jgi:hypothetical protein